MVFAGEIVTSANTCCAVTVTCEVLLILPFEAVIVVAPGTLAVKVIDDPVSELRVPTVSLLFDHVTCTAFPFWSAALNT